MKSPEIAKKIDWYDPRPLKHQFYLKEDDTWYNTDGIYFLEDFNGDVVYIGQSKDLLQRIRQHRNRFGTMSDHFWYASIIHLDKLNIDIFKTRAEAMNYYERLFINNMYPYLNRQKFKTSL